MSATQIRSSDGHASPCTQLNCFGPRPDSPSTPSTVPSSDSLYSRPGSESDVYKYCVGPFEMQRVHGAVSSGAFAGTLPRTGWRALSYGTVRRIIRWNVPLVSKTWM